jgi:hypothetical protein
MDARNECDWSAMMIYVAARQSGKAHTVSRRDNFLFSCFSLRHCTQLMKDLGLKGGRGYSYIHPSLLAGVTRALSQSIRRMLFSCSYCFIFGWASHLVAVVVSSCFALPSPFCRHLFHHLLFLPTYPLFFPMLIIIPFSVPCFCLMFVLVALFRSRGCVRSVTETTLESSETVGFSSHVECYMMAMNDSRSYR